MTTTVHWEHGWLGIIDTFFVIALLKVHHGLVGRVYRVGRLAWEIADIYLGASVWAGSTDIHFIFRRHLLIS